MCCDRSRDRGAGEQVGLPRLCAGSREASPRTMSHGVLKGQKGLTRKASWEGHSEQKGQRDTASP